MILEPISFADLPGWGADDHGAALAAFRASIAILQECYPGLADPDAVCPGGTGARDYFETCFVPHKVVPGIGTEKGFFTGYYEPVLKGSRQRSERYCVPLLARPDDLVTLVDDSLRASSGDALTHARRTADGITAYASRKEIEEGALDGRGLEFLFLCDEIEAYFLHIQGSGQIELDDGRRIRVNYAAKNGHPYTSIGRTLIEDGLFTPETMSLEALKAWLRAEADGGRSVLWRNKSYIFFRELGDADLVDVEGTRGIALTAGRSLAVDASIHKPGLPVFVAIDGFTGDGAGPDFRRLMIAQDVGSAIRGPARGDIFFGSGPLAGALAGATKHAGKMYVLLPATGGGER